MERAELIALLRASGCAEERGGEIFLCDPRWTKGDRSVFETLRGPSGEDRANPKGWLCIPTGGTSGTIRFARHDESSLTAAADGFLKHFRLDRVNAVDVLPAFHVSGLMARVRSAVSGGRHLPWNWKALEAGTVPSLVGDDWVISLVPTQLQRLLNSASAIDWLRRFKIIFVGGGPTWPALVNSAAEARLNASLSYGATETAAMVAAQRPEEFLSGDRSLGAALPHVAIAVGEDGIISVTGASVFRGYWPEVLASRTFRTDDLGEIDAAGRLMVLGRHDAVIISGGEKVNPLEVEAVLRATGEFSDVAVLGVRDAEWGERVVACYQVMEGEREPNLARVTGAVVDQLVAYKRPKDYVAIPHWPRNAQGKLNRRALKEFLKS